MMLGPIWERMKHAHELLFLDVVFSETSWVNHRSTWRRHQIDGLVSLRVFIGFIGQVAIIELVTVLVAVYSKVLVPLLDWPPIPSGYSSVFTILTFSLSLLLVFKTNSSYSRWWEGRCVWGQLVNFARNYHRLIITSCPEGEKADRVRQASSRWAVSSLYVLRGYILQKGNSSHLEAAHILSKDELSYLSQWTNPPSGCARALSVIVNEADWLNPMLRSQIELEVSLYVNMAGACERIYKTPIPPAYTRHTSRFLMIFLFFSPILLWPSTTWATLLIMPIISFLLIGIENIGAQIEVSQCS